jgi:hypothetical protein
LNRLPLFLSYNPPNGSGQEAPQMMDNSLEFPTVTTTAPVISCRVVGKNYCIQLEGEATLYIECNKFHQRFGKDLPKRGDVVTAVWYKFKEGKNYTLKQMYINNAH